ncbi:hypothetical protein, partial [Clostridioides difficile]|uniref:hypothetical protein n=1 Tax=Clostridioides difficile TaxID=1496 RepID=UPI001A9A631A
IIKRHDIGVYDSACITNCNSRQLTFLLSFRLSIMVKEKRQLVMIKVTICKDYVNQCFTYM